MTGAAARRAPIFVGLFLLSTACDGQRASAEQCAFILDKIVEVELVEQGFRDAALAGRKKTQLRNQFRAELERCRERPLRRGALACVGRAETTEEISHKCLR